MDYSVIDRSLLLNFLFYPRRDYSHPPQGAFDVMVPVEEGVEIHCRFYRSEGEGPWILYFHGNGEVVSDYDQPASYYLGEGLNLAVADYRGYGKSSGSPSLATVVKDASVILLAVKRELDRRELIREGLWVMGRSLGCISALKLAESHPEELKGMIVESGFISVVKLIRRLGLPSPGDLSALEEEDRRKAAGITLPSLIIHGERDTLVPLEQGEELYRSLASRKKRLFTVPLADHNNIFLVETRRYLREIRDFVAERGNSSNTFL